MPLYPETYKGSWDIIVVSCQSFSTFAHYVINTQMFGILETAHSNDKSGTVQVCHGNYLDVIITLHPNLAWILTPGHILDHPPSLQRCPFLIPVSQGVGLALLSCVPCLLSTAV